MYYVDEDGKHYNDWSNADSANKDVVTNILNITPKSMFDEVKAYSTEYAKRYNSYFYIKSVQQKNMRVLDDLIEQNQTEIDSIKAELDEFKAIKKYLEVDHKKYNHPYMTYYYPNLENELVQYEDEIISGAAHDPDYAPIRKQNYERTLIFQRWNGRRTTYVTDLKKQLEALSRERADLEEKRKYYPASIELTADETEKDAALIIAYKKWNRVFDEKLENELKPRLLKLIQYNYYDPFVKDIRSIMYEKRTNPEIKDNKSLLTVSVMRELCTRVARGTITFKEDKSL